MRILFLTSDKYPPYRPAARYIFEGQLPARGHQVDWIIQAENDTSGFRTIERPTGTVFLSPADHRPSRLHRLYKHALGAMGDLRVLRIVARKRYDIVQVKDKYLGGVLGLIAARRSGVPFVYWLAYPHAEESRYTAVNGFARYAFFYRLRATVFEFLLYRVLLPAADHVFVQSDQMQRDLSERGIPHEKMTPVPSAIEKACLPELAPEPETPTREKRIIYVGTLLRIRRIDFLVRVLARVKRRHPNTRLYLVGGGEDPEDEARIHAEARRLGIIDSVTITGKLPLEEAWRTIAEADVCLSPYYPTPVLRSTSPTKLVEYMAFAKPVVCNEHPEQNQVIAESGAGLVTPWAEDAFSDAVCEILDDPKRARDMGRRGRRYVEAHRTDVVVGALVEEIYQRLCAQKARRVYRRADAIGSE